MNKLPLFPESLFLVSNWHKKSILDYIRLHVLSTVI
jgi:hypothetical protein